MPSSNTPSFPHPDEDVIAHAPNSAPQADTPFEPQVEPFVILPINESFGNCEIGGECHS